MNDVTIGSQMQGAMSNMQLPQQMQMAIQAIMSGQTASYFMHAAQQLKSGVASVHNAPGEGAFFTGAFNANHKSAMFNSELDKMAPKKETVSFDPGVSTRRA